MNSLGDRFLTANRSDSLKREADNSISCWKGFFVLGVHVVWARKSRPQTEAVSSWPAHGCIYIFFFIHVNLFWWYLSPLIPKGIETVLPNPTFDATMPCERLKDVTKGRDRVARAEEDESKKSLKAGGSDGSQQWDFSSMAAHIPTWSLAKYWSWVAWYLWTWKATKTPTNQYKLFQQTTKQNIHWKEAKHWGEDVKHTWFGFLFVFF